jgi:hypothetical protein
MAAELAWRSAARVCRLEAWEAPAEERVARTAARASVWARVVSGGLVVVVVVVEGVVVAEVEVEGVIVVGAEEVDADADADDEAIFYFFGDSSAWVFCVNA